MSKKIDIHKLKKPFVILTIGIPLSGKSTWVNKNIPDDVRVISRDNIIMELSDTDDYNEAYKKVDEKKVNKILYESFLDSNKKRQSVIIDMTFMTSKRRRITLDYYKKDYYKLGVVFPFISKEEFEKRNEKRKIEEKKYIPYSVIENMLSNYNTIDQEKEGFDKIIYINEF